MKVVGWKDIPYSESTVKALVNLEPGKVLAVRMKYVNSSDPEVPKVQVEFAEKINFQALDGVRAAFTILNKSNKDFNKARRCWETAMPADVKSLIGLEIPDGESHCDINQVMNDLEGESFRLRIVETKEGSFTEDQKKYANNILKQNRNGDFFYASDDGQRIGVDINLVVVKKDVEMSHLMIEGTYIPASIESSTSNVGGLQVNKEAAI